MMWDETAIALDVDDTPDIALDNPGGIQGIQEQL